jgi:hypothetical protein
MKYSLDNIAYLINDSNYERLNQIYLKYWKPNGYQFESGRTVSAAYQHVKDILTDGPIHIVYNTEHKYLYFSYVKVKMYENYTIKDVNNLIMVE